MSVFQYARPLKKTPALPSPPTRTDLLTGTCRFQGVTVTTQQYGTFPCFGPELNMLELPADRLTWYQTHAAAGTNVMMIGWAGPSYESGGFTFPVPGPDLRWVHDLDGFADRIAEILIVGQMRGVLLMLPGDGITGRDGNTYGDQFVIQHLPALVAALQNYPLGDLTKYVIFCAGYDGVVWVWDLPTLYGFGAQFRRLLPNGYLSPGIYGAGIVGPAGEGKTQYTTPGQMDQFDLILQQFPIHLADNWDQSWQISARLLGPLYHRPPNQPPDDDPGAPFAAGSGQDLLSNGTPRGPYGRWGFEMTTYLWVRAWCDAAYVWQYRGYEVALGWPSVG